MSTELPWSISVLFISQFAKSMVMTIRSSYRVSIAQESRSVNVMSGMLQRVCWLTMWALLMAWKCLFLAELDAPPPLNSLKIVFTTVFPVSLWREWLLSLDRLLLFRFFSRALRLMLFRWGLLPLGLRSRRRPCYHRFATYLCNWPSWISSSILSLIVVHLPVLWPWQQ